MYPDPPPAYEECYNKTNDRDLRGTATNRLPIQEQPQTIRVRYIVSKHAHENDESYMYM